MSAGVAGGTGFALGSARAGAFGRIGAVGCELLIGSGHKSESFRFTDSIGNGKVYCGAGQVGVGEGVISWIGCEYGRRMSGSV